MVLVVIAGGIFAFLTWRSNGAGVSQGTLPGGTLPIVQNSSTQGIQPTDLSQATLTLGDAIISGADISSTMPSDAPQGATISFQAASGTVSLKNFYTGAQGYWFDLDAVLLQYNQSYVLWYYRGNSSFMIVLPTDGEDQAAAETALAQDLGVAPSGLCSLPVTVEYVFDRGGSSQELPLLSCLQQAL